MPKYIWIFVAFLLATPFSPIYPQSIGTLANRPSNSWVKAENGLIFSYHRGISNTAETGRMDVYRQDGAAVVSFDVLKVVPDAMAVSIYDVSAQPNQSIAVAAVYAKGPDVHPVAVLLNFDFKGILKWATALEPSKEIDLLEMDGESNIWTLTWSSAGKDVATTSRVIEYDHSGALVREMLPRVSFPLHAERLYQNQQAGAAAVGYIGGKFWLWLPGSTDLVLIDTETAKIVSQTNTGLPNMRDNSLWPIAIQLDRSGMVVGDFHAAPSDPNAKGELVHYAWSPVARTWASLDLQTCPGHRLIGTDGRREIYFRFDNTNSICGYDIQATD